MADEDNWTKGQNVRKSNRKKKENIRVFVQRKRLSASYTPKSNSMEKLTSIIGTKLDKNKQNIIVVNYKPVFMNSHKEKPQPTSTETSSFTSPVHRRTSMSTPSSEQSKTTPLLHRKSTSLDVPDVEDPFMFIEMMYQQLFTDDGQLRSGAEPTAIANCVKQMVTQSRRNSIAHRDSLSPNIHHHHQKSSPISFPHSMPSKRTSLSTSPRFMHHTFNEEEESHTLTHGNRTTNTSRR